MNYNKLSDQELVSRFVKGDTRSMESLITRHKNKVYTYLMLSVKNPHIADDLFQDTFIKVINSLKAGKYKDEGRFLSWVIRISHNLCIDYFRKEKNQNTWSNDDSEIDIFNSEKFSDKNIEESLVLDQITEDVRNLIEELPDDQKQVVLLRHYGGFSFKEIADQTDVSINTALGRMRYALINMRKIIEEKQINLSI
ncbi:MAG TPA: sigma-70 family RNA polymerase sigma factor [Bacteroidales bacterium]|jgi:RNA polymerase sigma-70 factor (ECF subfamily)|nr:sigma-70 family RNA polymerase sigma factor [Bacteroidales bacterium]MDD4235258.1 sigma-70 family RNA polymerase sigma factor [Bacteroidales bacterium]MDY0160360.1 sigma-70 family RNA polymerase sigma factor [Bacteroidales bacterium]HXK81400.1 sigma-70 family RNA polymerase sigma factor [Bacteroidales bacterium]